MTDARFATIGAVLAALIGVVNTYLAHRNEKRSEIIRTKVDKLVEQTNGMAEKINQAEFARGLKQGEDNPL